MNKIKTEQTVKLEEIRIDDAMKHLDIMHSILKDRANILVRWNTLRIDGVEKAKDPKLAEHIGRYNASKDILFLLGGGNLVDEYHEFEIKNIAEAVEEAERIA